MLTGTHPIVRGQRLPMHILVHSRARAHVCVGGGARGGSCCL